MLAIVTALSAGNTVDYSFNTTGSDIEFWGDGSGQRYDVAMRINDAALAGCRVKGFSVDVPPGISNAEGWVSTRLSLQSGVNSPTGPVVKAVVDGTKLTVTFPEPYTVPSMGLYVGYSFDAGVNDKAVAVVDGSSSMGLFMHSSSTMTSWKPMASSLGKVSSMVVSLEGSFADCAASVELDRDVYAISGKENVLPVKVTNLGSGPVTQLEMTVAIGDEEPVVNVLNCDVKALYGASQVINVPFVAPESTGEMGVTVAVDKVNGAPNEAHDKALTTEIAVVKFMPFNRPLIEEFTGTGCTYCPRGYVAMEEMNEKWGHDFIGIAYHNYSGDPMMVLPDFPVQVKGLPEASCNRAINFDAGAIAGQWEEARHDFVPADIDVTVKWTGEDELTATADVRFAIDFDDASNYRVGYALIEDDMSDPEWYQSNGYSGKVNSGTGKWWDIFIKGPSYILGLVYNDVVIGSSPFGGVQGSIPSVAEAGKTISHSFAFDINDCIGHYTRQSVVQNREKLRVVAYLVDSGSGRVINSNTSGYASTNSGIADDMTTAGTSVVSTRYYDLNGREIAAPGAGISVRVDLLDDGSRRSSKIYR